MPVIAFGCDMLTVVVPASILLPVLVSVVNVNIPDAPICLEFVIFPIEIV